MNDSKLVINLDFNSTRAHFLRAIQHQLDVITLLISGAQRVTAHESEPQGLHNFSPAHGAKLSHEEARKKGLEWLNNSFLRDAIETTDQFLGRCLSFCATIELASKGSVTIEALDHVTRVAHRKHHKLHFPAKFEELKEKYGISPNLSTQVLSLNKLRTCLVHRMGKVTPLDTNDEDRLVAKWITSQMVLRGLETGVQLVLTQPGQCLQEKAQLEMHIVDHEKTFYLDEHVVLEPYDTFSTIFTLWRFGLACNDAIEQYAIQLGVPVNRNGGNI
jgi:hypothetical protein